MRRRKVVAQEMRQEWQGGKSKAGCRREITSVNENGAKERPPTKSSRDTWSRVARLVAEHAAVKQVRLSAADHGVTVGFYETPSEPALEEIRQAVRKELSGGWNISVGPNGDWPSLHLHRIDGQTTEIHRAHPASEPAIIWKKINRGDNFVSPIFSTNAKTPNTLPPPR